MGPASWVRRPKASSLYAAPARRDGDQYAAASRRPAATTKRLPD
jgi:hypothetical protein